MSDISEDGSSEQSFLMMRDPRADGARGDPGGSLRRIPSTETFTSQATTSVESHISFTPPAPPPNSRVNTPYVRSLAGDLDQVSDKLSTEPGAITPPSTEAGSVNNEGDAMQVEGKPHLRSRVRGDMPLLQQLFKQPPKLLKRMNGRKVTPKPKRVGTTELEKTATITANNTEANRNTEVNRSEHFPEHSNWGPYAMEDVARGLERLAMLAKDLHQIDDSKTVQQHYSEKLAELLGEAEIKFDPSYML